MPKRLDLTGKQYGQLTVLRQMPGNPTYLKWECRCSCGNLITATSRELRKGSKKSCGCLKKQNKRTMDITGRRYGKLTALKPTDKKNAAGSIIWECRCDCGNTAEVSVSELNKGNCKSCGCLKEEYQKLVRDRLHLVDGTCVEWLEGRRKRSDNTSGFRGVFRKKNGKYSVTIGFKKKIFYVGVFSAYEEAIEARLEAEKYIFKGFLTAHKTWESMAEKDPDWAAENPFEYEVTKENGRLVVHSSMEKYIPKRMKSISESQNRQDTLLMHIENPQITEGTDVATFINFGNGEEAKEQKEQELVHI